MGYNDSTGWASVFNELETINGITNGELEMVFRSLVRRLEDMDFDVWDELEQMVSSPILSNVLTKEGLSCGHDIHICADCGEVV